jgi:hypothetical protein
MFTVKYEKKTENMSIDIIYLVENTIKYKRSVIATLKFLIVIVDRLDKAM